VKKQQKFLDGMCDSGFQMHDFYTKMFVCLRKTIKMFVLELTAWCDLHKTRIFLISERGVPENHHEH
jgi:hypothetical protein